MSAFHIASQGTTIYNPRKEWVAITDAEITGCSYTVDEDSATHLFVTPNGEGVGSNEDPCSVFDALDILREAVKHQTSDIVVYVAGGEYNLAKPLRIDSGLSGSNGFFVHWKGDESNRPIFTSYSLLSGWVEHDVQRGIWRVPLPDMAPVFEHLWLPDGTSLPRAWSGFSPSFLRRKGASFYLDSSFDTPFTEWRNPEDVVFIAKHFWYYLAGPATIQDERKVSWGAELEASMSSGPVLRGNHNAFVANVIGMRKPIAVENAYELLTDPGEWYLDRAERTLYIIPPKDNSWHHLSEVLYPKARTLIRLDGTLEEPVHNMIISGLDFRYTDGDKTSSTASSPTESVAMSPKPGEGALQLNAGKNIRVESCSFKYIGNEALNVDITGDSLTIARNAFAHTAGTAISVVQSNLEMPEKWWSEISEQNRPKMFCNTVISDNYLRDVVEGNYRFAHGIAYSELVSKLLISHNEIARVAGAGIRNTWRYGATYGGHAEGVILSWNKISAYCQKDFEDFSGLYLDCANGRLSNSIHHNHVDGVGKAIKTHPIYLDVRVQNTDVYENVITNMVKAVDPAVGGPFWIVFIGCHDNRAFNNWIQGASRKAHHFDSKTVFWWKKRNHVFDNTFYESIPEHWPRKAQDVIVHAGSRDHRVRSLVDDTA